LPNRNFSTGSLINMTNENLSSKLRVILFLLAATALPAGEIIAQGTYTPNIDLPYVNDGNVRHMLDLYTPNGATGPVPLIIWIHGGGWQSGSKSLNPNGPQIRYAQNGYAVASLNYRLSGEAIFPAQIHDCKAAIRWLRANAATYNLDPARFGVWGSSAGGHLAALVATSNDVTDMEGTVGANPGFSSRVQAAGDWFGPTDFLQMDTQAKQAGCGGSTHDSPTSPESLLLGCSIQTCPDAAARANPMTYVSGDDPPIFIQHGLTDCTVSYGQSQILQTLFQSIGHDSSLSLFAATGHGGAAFTTPENLAFLDNFWDQKLRVPTNPLIESVRIFRKSREIGQLIPGTLGSLYRIKISGRNLGPDSKIILNGVERGGELSGVGELTIHGFPGTVISGQAFTLQVRNANGRYSNVIRPVVQPN
jgi:acetyl esterase/lipase